MKADGVLAKVRSGSVRCALHSVGCSLSWFLHVGLWDQQGAPFPHFTRGMVSLLGHGLSQPQPLLESGLIQAPFSTYPVVPWGSGL